jgi:hypothetical protein
MITIKSNQFTKLKESKMTQNEFVAKCEQLSVAPELALENDLIVSALQSKNDALVIALLLTQF